jgi:hypothetical protein
MNRWRAVRCVGCAFVVTLSALSGLPFASSPKGVQSPCGSVELPPLATQSGVICLGACGPGHSHQACVAPDQASSLPIQEPAVSGLDHLSVLAIGRANAVAGFGAVLHAATGWQVQFVGEAEALVLKPQRWATSLAPVFERRLRTTTGRAVRLSVDQRRQAILFSVAP